MKKTSFLEILAIFLSAKEKVIKNFKNKIFLIKHLVKIPTPAPERAPKPGPDPAVFHTPK